MATGRHFIGTSGWHYNHWIGPFYPQDVRRDRLLDFYAGRFRTVEINNTFYRLPSEDAVESWRRDSPPDFVFACKGSRYITHMKKLKGPAAGFHRFFDLVSKLGDKLGPILFQTPAGWRANPPRLEQFLETLPKRRRYAFELRDASWWTTEIFDILQRHKAAFCAFDLDRRQSPVRITADFTYIRLHGPDGPYQGRYDGRTLAGWARRFEGWLRDGLDVYCYFDNDQAGHAPADALRLIEMVDGK